MSITPDQSPETVAAVRPPRDYTASWESLARAETQIAAAIALGRRLLANPHPSRPFRKIQMWETSDGLMIWADGPGTSGIEAWASLLDAEIITAVVGDEPLKVHYCIEGVLDGVPVYPWTILSEPITSPVICESTEAGWRVDYTQSGTERSVDVADAVAARAWIAKYATAAVAA